MVFLVKMGAIRRENYLEIIAAMNMMIWGLEEEEEEEEEEETIEEPHYLMNGVVISSRILWELTNITKDTSTKRIIVLVAILR